MGIGAADVKRKGRKGCAAHKLRHDRACLQVVVAMCRFPVMTAAAIGFRRLFRFQSLSRRAMVIAFRT
jgi:hypothetical protein